MRRPEVIYTLDFGGRKSVAGENSSLGPGSAEVPIPRITRLLALAIRFEGLLQNKEIRDYAELARLGRVTRARITQIMKLLDLAPDIQEQILFWHPERRLNERNLRPIANQMDWQEQRRMFQRIQA